MINNSELKYYQKIILAYIYKYRAIDFYILRDFIDLTPAAFNDEINDLFEKGYIAFGEDKIIGVTELALQYESVKSWDLIEEAYEAPTYTEEVYSKLKWDKTLEIQYNGSTICIPDIRNLCEFKASMQLSDMDKSKYISYHKFEIPKKNSNKTREIYVPNNELKARQKWIQKNILCKIPTSEYAHGFVTGRSTVTNAECHCLSKVMLQIDLKDFFPSVRLHDIKEIFKKLGYNSDVCEFLVDTVTFGGRLPQGAPTSPTISNIVFENVDKELGNYAKANGLIYSRYADDITISSNDSFDDLKKHYKCVKKIVNKNGYCVNHKKTHYTKENEVKYVTGISIYDGNLHVPRRIKRELRKHLFYLEKFGVTTHLSQMKRELNAGYKAYIYGMAFYAKMVEPDYGTSVIKRLNDLYSCT